MCKIFYVLLLWLCCIGAFAPLQAYTILPTSSDVVACNLPAPTGFTVTNVGATYAALQWNTVAGAAQYELKTYETGGFSVISTLYLPGTATTATVGGLQMGTGYHSVIAAICPDLSVSGNRAFVDFETIIIIDLIAEAPAPSLIESCSLSTTFTTCGTFPWGSAYQYFKIKNGNNATFFRLSAAQTCTEKGESITVPQVQRTGTNGNDYFVHILDDNNSSTASCTNSIKIAPYNNYSTPICHLTIQGPQQGQVVGTVRIDDNGISTGYSIWRMVSGEGGGPRGAGDGFQEDATQPWAVNPFTDELEVTLPGSSTESDRTTLTLFDLSGKPIKSWQSPGNAGRCILPTPDLLPGLYLLRVLGGDGKSEVLRVVKSLN